MPETGDLAKQFRGNAPDTFKRLTPDKGSPKSELARVRVWNQRIKRAQEVLRHDELLEKARKGAEYLTGEKITKGQKVYMPYLTPMLEDSHRRTFPSIPSPRIEERTETVSVFADQIRELVNYVTNAPRTSFRKTAEQVQWDDDLYGVGFMKTVWRVKHDPLEPARVTDPLQLEPQVAKALEENLDPLSARVAEDDLDHVHHRVHMDELAAMAQEDPRNGPLNEHLAAHEAELVTIRREFPVVERVHPLRFVYDTDESWENRAWEAELVSMRITDMFEMKYKNLNIENLMPENKGKFIENWEDMTARVWQVHGRRENKYFVVPVNDTGEGLFLFQSDWPYGPLDIYVPVVFHPQDPDVLTGESVVALTMPTLDRLAEVDFFIDRHVKTHASYQALFPSGSLSNDDRAGLNDPNKRRVDLAPEAIMGMKELKPPPIPDTLLQFREILVANLRKITGSDAQDTGEANPHQITASESVRRGASSDARLDTRQEVLGAALAQVSVNFLGLYRKFATKNISISNTAAIETGAPEFLSIDPSDLPADIYLFFDLKGETDEVRQAEFANAREWGDVVIAHGYPLDIVQFDEYLGRRAGIRRPEQFRQQLAEAGGIAPQSPGIPGETSGAGAPGPPENLPFLQAAGA